MGLDSSGNDYIHDCPAAFVPFTVWVVIEPGEDGLDSLEYGIEYSDWLTFLSSVDNPLLTSTTNEERFFTIEYTACQSETDWIHQHTFLPTLGAEIGDIRFVDPGSQLSATNCLSGNPAENIIANWSIYINYEPQATEVSSWGAIKGLYK